MEGVAPAIQPELSEHILEINLIKEKFKKDPKLASPPRYRACPLSAITHRDEDGALFCKACGSIVAMRKQNLARVENFATTALLKGKTESDPDSHCATPASPPYDAMIVYLIRHGQGTHNVANLQTNVKCNCFRCPSGPCPYKDPELFDPHLTPLGREQARELGNVVPRQVSTITVSTLDRTLQTALSGFGDRPDATFIAHELLREQCGLHTPDKRRSIAEKKQNVEFSRVSFHLVDSEEDNMWTEDREPKDKTMLRGQEFLDWLFEAEDGSLRNSLAGNNLKCRAGGISPFSVNEFQQTRADQTTVHVECLNGDNNTRNHYVQGQVTQSKLASSLPSCAMVSHSAFLITLTNLAVDCGDHQELKAWFAPGECRSCIIYRI